MNKKQAAYERLRNRCGEFLDKLYRGERMMVFGEGNLSARVMLVGEAPGERETIQRRPFVGQAGKHLDALLQTLHLSRGEVYFTYVVKFRPTKTNERTGRLNNRPPTREEVLLCRPYLYDEIALVAPRLIVALGNAALRAVSGEEKAMIGQWHGRNVELGDGRTLYAMYHPASLVYNPGLREPYERDARALAALVHGEPMA